ncbi:MAG: helix-turn-helix domain-containing protein [Micropepsaceae bacterium]
MKRRDLGMLPSTFAAAVAEVGDAWTLLIVKELVLGTNRFDSLIAQTGIAESSLSQRLKHLEQCGIVTRRAYQQKPVRYEYDLTPKGEGLGPTLLVLMQWGDRWMGGDTPPVHYRCAACGNDPKPLLACSCCRTPLTVQTAIPVVTAEAAAIRTARAEAFQKKKSERNAA